MTEKKGKRGHRGRFRVVGKDGKERFVRSDPDRPKVVYKYGAVGDLDPESEELVGWVFRLAHDYRNRLCEVYRLKRQRYYEAISALDDRLPKLWREIGHEGGRGCEPTGLHAKLETAKKNERTRRMVTRSRKADTKSPEHAAVKKARAKLSAKNKERKDIEKAIKDTPQWKPISEQLSADHDEEIKRARARIASNMRLAVAPNELGIKVESYEVDDHDGAEIPGTKVMPGLHDSTYNLVEAACKQGMTKGAPPQFLSRWDSKPKLGVQVKRLEGEPQLTIDAMLGGEDRWVKLFLSPRPKAQPGSRRSRRMRGELWLRLASLGADGKYSRGGHTPVWAKIPFAYAREIPRGCDVKRADVTRRRVGRRWRWSVLFTLEYPKHYDLHPERAKTGKVGLDLGWRVLPDRFRIACWAGSDGDEGELCLPKWWLKEYLRCRRIQKHRDELFDKIRSSVAKLAKDRKDRAWIKRTRAKARVADWVRELEIAGGVPREVREWRTRENHLHDYETGLREQLKASRTDLYRKFAAALSNRYETVGLEDMDLREFQLLGDVEDGEDYEEDYITKFNRAACLSALRNALEARMRKTEKVNRAGTTEVCQGCGRRNRINGALHYVCVGCGEKIDRDVNAARNILDRATGDRREWRYEALASDNYFTIQSLTPNRDQRRAAQRRANDARDDALEMERTDRDRETA